MTRFLLWLATVFTAFGLGLWLSRDSWDDDEDEMAQPFLDAPSPERIRRVIGA